MTGRNVTYSENETLSSAKETELVPAPLPLFPISGQKGPTHLQQDWIRHRSIPNEEVNLTEHIFKEEQRDESLKYLSACCFNEQQCWLVSLAM